MSEKLNLGQARTQAETEAEAMIATVPLFAGRSVSYAMMSGGLSNSNWRVEAEGDARAYFLKIPGKGSELFINRKASNQAARLAHEHGVGAEVVYFDPVSGLEVTEFLEGYRASTNVDFLDPEIWGRVTDLYRAFHACPPLLITRTIFEMVEEHIGQASELKATLPADFAVLHARYQDAKRAFTASGLDITSCFNDPMPGNFLLSSDNQVKLVDFEWASNNERYYDLGVWIGEMFYSEEVTAEIARRYFGSASPQHPARLTVMRAVADFKWALWAMVQERISSLDFDYHKYGAWKFMRARLFMDDQRWTNWLHLV
ncbi:MAG TPA: choline/ethanolamine kinase family protein [Nordella sp.]|nr:choline/ethanolamine kinase family protein [Nordella sp.]